MGVDTRFAMELITDQHLVAGKKNAVMLGRQGFVVKPRHFTYLRRRMKAHGLMADPNEFAGPDGFAEPFFDRIGYPPIQSMDFSSYEGCDIVQDLNEPPADALRESFDVIIDGGTIEHVFNTPQALDTVFHMLRPGGIFISINGITGWAGHGFYQFSPELVWRYWGDARGCKVHRCIAASTDPGLEPRNAADTGKSGQRFRGKGMDGRWYLYYVIEKSNDANQAERITNTSQADYVVRWTSGQK